MKKNNKTPYTDIKKPTEKVSAPADARAPAMETTPGTDMEKETSEIETKMKAFAGGQRTALEILQQRRNMAYVRRRLATIKESCDSKEKEAALRSALSAYYKQLKKVTEKIAGGASSSENKAGNAHGEAPQQGDASAKKAPDTKAEDTAAQAGEAEPDMPPAEDAKPKET